jgi:A/G-specific adenine glycosylase
MPESISKPLLAWYARNRRDLPWRHERDPYAIWLSEVMLQQTRVETVIPYYTRFLERFPTLGALAASAEEEVLALWSGLGYYRRARSLWAGARAVAENHGGEFPRRLEDALSLPGVGPYTARAVLSIAHGTPLAVVDGNVERVVTRLLRLSGDPRKGETARAIRAAVDHWLPADEAGDFNQAMMELGATVCTPSEPRCPTCPVSSHCAANTRGDQDRYPESAPRRATVEVRLEAALLRRGSEYLLSTPEDFGFLDGLWVFPLVDVTTGSGPPGTIAAALGAKLGADLRATARLAPIRHSITYRRIAITPVVLDGEVDEPLPTDRYRWATIDELGATVPVSSMCTKIAASLRSQTRPPPPSGAESTAQPTAARPQRSRRAKSRSRTR